MNTVWKYLTFIISPITEILNMSPCDVNVLCILIFNIHVTELHDDEPTLRIPASEAMIDMAWVCGDVGLLKSKR
jgi:hypothetical protein